MISQLLLSLDVGDRYVGYALFSMPGGQIAQIGALRGKKKELFAQTITMIGERDIISCVVGIPFGLSDGSVTEQGQSILKFCEKMSSRTALPIFLIDESFSTSETEEALGITSIQGTREVRNRKKMKQSGVVDGRSAERIGRRYLEGPPMYTIYPLAELLKE